MLLTFANVIMHNVTKDGRVVQLDYCHKGIRQSMLYSYQLVCGKALNKGIQWILQVILSLIFVAQSTRQVTLQLTHQHNSFPPCQQVPKTLNNGAFHEGLFCVCACVCDNFLQSLFLSCIAILQWQMLISTLPCCNVSLVNLCMQVKYCFLKHK